MTVAFPAARPYLDQVEERLREAVSSSPGLVERLGAEALEAGGKRLRPLVPVPVLDCLQATLAALPSAAPARAAMQPAPSTGLSPPLSALLARGAPETPRAG